MEAVMIDAVFYDEWDKCWKRSLNGYYGKEEVITKGEAMEIIESYGCVDFVMNPVALFPLA